MKIYKANSGSLENFFPYVAIFKDGEHKGEVAGCYNTLKHAKIEEKGRNTEIRRVV